MRFIDHYNDMDLVWDGKKFLILNGPDKEVIHSTTMLHKILIYWNELCIMQQDMFGNPQSSP
ncbi:MAG: hypothetical protein JW920_05150 [Deltaproteobacteria bacterium]|nr:hypothetical protein [Deltaproteobacteria bacterium]